MEGQKCSWNSGENHPMFGKKHSKATIEKMRLAKLGNQVNLGRVRTQEFKQKCSESKLGEKNPAWKGDDVNKHSSLHTYVRKYLPKPDKCENCNLAPPYDLANVTGNYVRDFINWKYLCRKCHMVSDGRLVKLHKKRDKNASL